MRTGFIISLLLHTAFLWVVLVGLPRFNDSDPIPMAIPVGVISEADLARLDVLPSEPATLVEPPQIEVPDEPPPLPEPEVAALPPVPVQRPEPPQAEPELPELREPEPQPEAQLAPEPVLPEPELVPPLEPVPALEPEPEPVSEPEPEPEPEQEPEIAEEPEPVTELAEDVPPEPVEAEEPPETQVAALPSPPLPPRRPEPPQAEPEAEPESTFGSLLSSLAGGQIASRPTNASRLPLAQEQAVRAAVERCWNIDPGARDVRSIVVEVAIEMRQDGTVADAQIVDRGRYASDPTFRSAADRARRAVLNTNCQPWPLPAATYDDWREITMNFDPRDLFF